jgi:hypothetical protein
MSFSTVPTALTYALILGVPLGLYVALVSHRHDALRGGLLAQIFHALGCIGFTTSLPAILIDVFILRGGLAAALLSGVVTFGVSLAMLMIYAVFEQPARARLQQVDDQGWTADKARSSGL